MSDQQKQDSRELATMLEALPKEDRLQVRGVITGMQLARRVAAVNNQREPQQFMTCDAAPESRT